MRMHHHCGYGDYQFSGRHFGGRGGFSSSGRGGTRGGGFPFGRMFRDGDLRLVTLALIEEEPRHGYDIIKALEQRSSGFYSPSPGVIYPTLTFLDEAGYATSSADGNKKVYTITDAGKAHVADNREHVDTILSQMESVGRRMSRARDWFDQAGDGDDSPGRESKSEAAQSLDQARRRLRALIVAATEGTDDDQRRVAEILDRASNAILGKSGDS